MRISKKDFIDIIRRLESYKFSKKIEDFVDVYAENVRTRYIFSQEFGKYIFLDSIIKNRISNVDISMKELINLKVTNQF